jgi:hypothetical protein
MGRCVDNEKAMLLVFAAIGAVLVAGLIWWSVSKASKAWRKYQRIVDTPTSKIGQLKNGFFEARGKVVPAAEPLISPLSRTPCVYFQFMVKEKKTTTHDSYSGGRRRSSTQTKWVTIINDRKARDVEIEDATGRVHVPMLAAELHLKRDNHASSGFLNSPSEELKHTLAADYGKETTGLVFNKALSYEETVVRGNELLYVIGPCRRTANGAATFEPKQGEMFVVADQPEQVIARKFKLQAMGLLALAIAIGLGAIAAAVVALRAGA